MDVVKNIRVQLYKIINSVSNPTFIFASKLRCSALSIKKHVCVKLTLD